MKTIVVAAEVTRLISKPECGRMLEPPHVGCYESETPRLRASIPKGLRPPAQARVAVVSGPKARMIPAWGIAPHPGVTKSGSANGAINSSVPVWDRPMKEGMGRAFSPCTVVDALPGALPQAGMGSRRWRSGATLTGLWAGIPLGFLWTKRALGFVPSDDLK